MFGELKKVVLSLRLSILLLLVNFQSGGQNNKIVLHLKDLLLSGDRTTIVLFPRLGITEMGLCSVFIFFVYLDKYSYKPVYPCMPIGTLVCP